MLFDALVALVRELSGERPLVLVLEDLHWADAMSARFLAFLGRRLESLPVLVIASMRPEELVDAPVAAQALKELRGEGRLDEVTVAPLSEAEGLALAEAVQPTRRRRGDPARTARELWKLGHAYFERGDAASAIPILEQAVQGLGSIPIRSAERRYLACLAEGYLLAGDVVRARATAARALEDSRADGMPFNIGLAQRALARVMNVEGAVEEAERQLQQALTTFRQCRANVRSCTHQRRPRRRENQAG